MITPEQKERRRIKAKIWYKANREISIKRARAWRFRNIEKARSHNNKWGKGNRDKTAAYSRAWVERNPEKERIRQNKKQRAQRVKDPRVRMRQKLSSRLRDALKRQAKTSSILKILGCDLDWLKAWLEIQFKDGMTWDNYRYTGWHIDHIKPCAVFDLSDPHQQKLCFHWTNLQPMWAEDNRLKNDTWEEAA